MRMRIRKVVVLCVALLMVVGCFLLYIRMNVEFPFASSSEFTNNKWIHFEDKLRQLEEDLNKHHEAVGEIKEVIKHLVPASSSVSNQVDKSAAESVALKSVAHASEMIYEKTCPIKVSYPPNTDIQMLQMYKELKFDNPDGGAWKQGFKITYDVRQWNKHHKLKVFVVPHSHNDPGWLKTVEDYYVSQTKHILNNMVEKLSVDRRRKFIWAEISYFSMWWDDVDDTARRKVKDLIQAGQLEIVTGGWVMNDEANTHWLSMTQQMIEGHQWLQKNLNYTPISSWSIDPFGQSPTMTLLLKEMGLKHLLIQRVHYSVKKELSSNVQLEFRWKQLWDSNGATELFTHMMPFYSYDVPHTCGPDPKICCQFDFKRLPGRGVTCPWRVPPQVIDDDNVAARAQLLLDQYRKKSQLYRTNVVLAPLGDDFRYDHQTEWDDQYNNYQRLFDYMNTNSDLNIEIQFGTLTDYFNAVKKEKSIQEFPTLTGDFFTYADRADHYWSGYYTSRPFYKRMDRVLLSYLRAAEIILALAYGSGKQGSQWILSPEAGLVELLSQARKNLSVFQHHDGITGTARDHVVVDYGQKMLSSLIGTHHVIQQSANVLLSGPASDMPGSEIIHYSVDDARRSHDSLPVRQVITIGPGVPDKKVVLFNSLPYTRHEVVTFYVSTPFVKVTDLLGKTVKCQVSPVFEYDVSISESKYQIAFIANIPALGLAAYTITAVEDFKYAVRSSVNIYNHYSDIKPVAGFDNIEVSPSSREFTIQNSRVTAAFNKLGLLKAVRVGANTVPVHLDFAKYGVRRSAEMSGAYLFLPDGDAQPLQIESTVVKVLEGPVFSSVVVQLPKVLHTVTLYNTPGADSLGLEIENVVNIRETSNYELVMRLSTNINNSDEFFTDLNGYQIIRRKRFPKLPLQANYYPIPTMAYIEDRNIRLSVLTAGPLGCSSLREGQIEVMQDRRLSQDDNRGLGQGVLDNHATKHTFRIILEKRTHRCQAAADNHPAGFPTLSAHMALQSLLNPLIKLLRTADTDEVSRPGYTSVSEEFGVDFTLPLVRTGVLYKQSDDNVGIIVQRQHLDVCFSDRVLLEQFPMSNGTVNLGDLLPRGLGNKLYKSSLSFLKKGDAVNAEQPQALCPMEVQAYIIHR